MMIDTSFAIDLMRERRRRRAAEAVAFLRANSAAKLRMPVFALCELELGVARSTDAARERAALRHLTEYVEVIPPEPGFAEIYARIAAALLAAGTPIPIMDALIAATAIQHAEPLVTRDTEHFCLVDGLTVLGY